MTFVKRKLFHLTKCFLGVSFFLSCSVNVSKNRTPSGVQQITPGLIMKHVEFLASDSLMGRNTPSPGLDTAAAYISRTFKDMGLMPVNGSYYQRFALCIKNLGDSSHFSIVRNGTPVSYNMKSDYVPFEISGDKEIEGEILFAGYGITAEEYHYDDYANINANGKIVLIFRHEPRENDSLADIFNGNESTIYSNLKEKVSNAKKHGAIGILVVTEPMNHHSIKPRGFPWPALSKTLPKDAGPVTFCQEGKDDIPVIHIGEEVIKCLLGSIDSLTSLQNRIDESLTSQSFLIPDAKVLLRTSVVSAEKYNTMNVVGLLEGSDPEIKNEIIVIGAHYDHVGFVKEHKSDTDYIYNGADDNASGTSGVLAVAQGFATLKTKPKRSVLFILFAGEEKGLYGSSWYVNHPLLPLEKTIAMLNLDMISRNSPDTLELIGAKQCSGLKNLITKENKPTGFILLSKKMSGGSDHWNFYQKNIPSIFFFSGLHKDYHQTSDNPDKINALKAARVAQLVFHTAWELSNDNQYFIPEYTKNKEE